MKLSVNMYDLNIRANFHSPNKKMEASGLQLYQQVQISYRHNLAYSSSVWLNKIK